MFQENFITFVKFMEFTSNSLCSIHHKRMVLERRNENIMEMTCRILETKHFSSEYWVEEVATIVYIMNKFPTKSVKNKVPQEAWTCMKHNVVHLIFFGYVSYTHVLDEMRNKLDKKDINVYLLGILKIQKHTGCMILLKEKS
jgi:hypothetical protein